MKIRFIIALLIGVTVFVSCLRQTRCILKPIELNAIDSIQMKGDFIFQNESGNTDTLALIDCYNIFKKVTEKSLMSYEKCEHSIGFDYDSKDKKGTISVGLHKNEKNEYQFSINGFCISHDIKMSHIDVEKDSLIIIDIQKCDESDFKTIAFRKCKIEYFETQDGDIWKPIKFIPRQLKR